MKIDFSDEGGYSLTIVSEQSPNPRAVWVNWERIFNIVDNSRSLNLENEEDRHKLLEDLAKYATVNTGL